MLEPVSAHLDQTVYFYDEKSSHLIFNQKIISFVKKVFEKIADMFCSVKEKLFNVCKLCYLFSLKVAFFAYFTFFEKKAFENRLLAIRQALSFESIEKTFATIPKSKRKAMYEILLESQMNEQKMFWLLKSLILHENTASSILKKIFSNLSHLEKLQLLAKQDDLGNTLFHVACMNSRLEVVESIAKILKRDQKIILFFKKNNDIKRGVELAGPSDQDKIFSFFKLEN